MRLLPAAGLLSLLAASVLAPVAVAAAGGAAVAAALAGVAGNVGSDLLAGLVDQVARRLTRTPSGDVDETEARDALERELCAVLKREGVAADPLRTELITLVRQVDAFAVALDAAAAGVRQHLEQSFAELQAEAARHQQGVDHLLTEQRRNGQSLRQIKAATDEVRDRLRAADRRDRDRPDPPRHLPTPPIGPGVGGGATLVPAGPSSPVTAPGWHAGDDDVVIGDTTYLLEDHLLHEQQAVDRSWTRRQARALRLLPTPGQGTGHVWLRQVEQHQATPAARSAAAALDREEDLLQRLGRSPGFPGNAQVVRKGRTTTLAVTWPASDRRGVACDTLSQRWPSDTVVDDPWHLARLLQGLAGLCRTLGRLHTHGVAHRALAPEAIVVLDQGPLVLRDLGLAAHEPVPGEGPVTYQAPEQRRGTARAGAIGLAVDSYLLAAIAYHLLSGHPPPATRPLPLTAVAPTTPLNVSGVVDAGLLPAPGDRPPIEDLAAAFASGRPTGA